ncbi:MAG: hypothetical protein NVV82_25795 [Sporocytophaga sp.]|nr:hypothetical protein [Sporocytophaga sp.]
MILKKISLSTILLFCFTITTFSQENLNKKTDGISFLKDQSKLNIQFNYEGMLIVDKPEGTFLTEKQNEKNAKEPGAGDRWFIAWQHNKTDDFPRRFKVLFNKYIAKKPLRAVSDSTVEYTLIIKTLKMDPSLYSGGGHNAHADLEFLFVKTTEPEKILCKLRLKEVQGSAGFASFDEGLRMQECYAVAGRLIAKYIIKNAYKKSRVNKNI